MSPAPESAALAAALAAVRARRPLVLNVANLVVTNIAANALLAVGASPIMAEHPAELPDLIAISGAVVLNLGSISGDFAGALRIGAVSAKTQDVPFVFDPVAFGVTRLRDAIGRPVLEQGPSVIRGNASEVLALAADRGLVTAQGEASGSGVDSRHDSRLLAQPAMALARATGSVVAMTGAVDLITDGRSLWRLENGHPLMAAVTGSGCMLSALTGAVLAVERDPLLAATAALSWFAIAGEIAAEGSAGPGSFMPALFDALHRLQPTDLAARLKLESVAA